MSTLIDYMISLDEIPRNVGEVDEFDVGPVEPALLDYPEH